MMLDRYAILIVEDDGLLATSLATAVSERACDVVGPAGTVAAALASIGAGSVDAAVLDARLPDRDVTPVVMELIDKAIPFVIHTGVGLPAELAAAFPHVSVILKPTDPDEVVAQLLQQIHRFRDAASGRLAAKPPTAPAETAPRAAQVARIAAALFDQFGDKAMVLARRQAAGAEGEVLATWSEIIADLAGRSPQGDHSAQDRR